MSEIFTGAGEPGQPAEPGAFEGNKPVFLAPASGKKNQNNDNSKLSDIFLCALR
jgi:hypothetical protein